MWNISSRAILGEVMNAVTDRGHKVCAVTGRKPELSPQDGVDKFWKDQSLLVNGSDLTLRHPHTLIEQTEAELDVNCTIVCPLNLISLVHVCVGSSYVDQF